MYWCGVGQPPGQFEDLRARLESDDALQVARRTVAHAQLDGAVAGLDVRQSLVHQRRRVLEAQRHAAGISRHRLGRSAQQLVQRPAHGLAADVPQRQVDAAAG